MGLAKSSWLRRDLLYIRNFFLQFPCVYFFFVVTLFIHCAMNEWIQRRKFTELYNLKCF